MLIHANIKIHTQTHYILTPGISLGYILEIILCKLKADAKKAYISTFRTTYLGHYVKYIGMKYTSMFYIIAANNV